MAGVRASLLCICFTRTDKAIVMRSQIRSRSPRTYFLINEFGGWRAGNYRQSPPGNCQKGSGFWKVRAGPEVSKVVSARLSITMLGWGQVRSSPHDHGSSHRASQLLCWRGSWVQTGAELGSGPHSSQGTKQNLHLIVTALVPALDSPGQQPCKEGWEGSPSDSSPFPSPVRHTSSQLPGPTVRTLHDQKPGFPPGSGDLAQPRRSTTISYRDKGN